MVGAHDEAVAVHIAGQRHRQNRQLADWIAPDSFVGKLELEVSDAEIAQRFAARQAQQAATPKCPSIRIDTALATMMNRMTTSTPARYQGVFPVVPTTFQENGELDLASQKRCGDFMIDAGFNGLCILANFSEQFLLSDDERELLIRTILEHVAGRVPVIVTTTGAMTGGQTSGACVQALGISQMKIGPQIDPGVPWCHAQSDAEPIGGLHLTLKSGNFGADDDFWYSSRGKLPKPAAVRVQFLEPREP
jgi:hypothetical protein